MAGAGKTESADYFVKRRGFSKIWFGGVIVNAVRAMGLETNQANERKYREELRAKYGMAAVAVKVYDELIALRKKTNKILLESLYSWEEYIYLKEKFPELILAAIYARPPVRYARLKVRPQRPMDEKTARERDKSQIQALHQGGPIAIADFLVINEGAKKELHQRLEDIYGQIKRKNYYQD